jgi:hypothetical protein
MSGRVGVCPRAPLGMRLVCNAHSQGEAYVRPMRVRSVLMYKEPSLVPRAKPRQDAKDPPFPVAPMASAPGTATETCAVCHDELTEGTHELACGHHFHTDCVLNWFRRGAQTCPSCRDPGLPAEESPIGALALYARASTLRRHAQRRAAPRELVTLVRRVQRAEHDLAATKRAIQEHKRANKDVLAKARKLHCKEFRHRRDLSTGLRALGLYEDGTLRLPALLVDGRNPNDLRGGLFIGGSRR